MGTRRNDALEQATNGATLITDTAAHAGNFGRIIIIEAAAIAAITADADFVDGADIVGLVLAANLDMPFKCSSITLTSGSVLAIHDA